MVILSCVTVSFTDFVQMAVFSFNGASQVEGEGKEKGERRHSHAVAGVTDSLTLPLASPTSLPRKTSMGEDVHVDWDGDVLIVAMNSGVNSPRLLTSAQPSRRTSEDDTVQQHPNPRRLFGAVRSVPTGQHVVLG